MNYANMKPSLVIEHSFSKLNLPSNWSDGMTGAVAANKDKMRPAVNTKVGVKNVLESNVNTAVRSAERSSTKQYAGASRSQKKESDRAQQDLVDAMTIVKVVMALPDQHRVWALYAYTEAFADNETLVIRSVMASLSDMPKSWHGDFVKCHQITELVRFIVRGIRSKRKIRDTSNQCLAGVIGLKDRSAFRTGEPWALFKEEIFNVLRDLNELIFARVKDAAYQVAEKQEVA